VYCWAGDGAGMIPTAIIIAKIAHKPTAVSTYLHVAPTASYGGMISCDHGLLEEYATGGKDVPHSGLLVESADRRLP
jgi:hypothetical protein